MRQSSLGSATLYALDVICMVMAISLIGISLYLLPYVLGFQQYDVPEFFVTLFHWYETHSTMGGFMIAVSVLLPFLVAGLGFIFISRLITYYLETHGIEPGVPHVDAEEYEEHLQRREHAARHISKATWLVLTLMAGIVLVLFLLEYYLIIEIFN